MNSLGWFQILLYVGLLALLAKPLLQLMMHRPQSQVALERLEGLVAHINRPGSA